MVSRLNKKDIEQIERKLNTLKYNQIPKEFIKVIDQEFSTFAYLKSLIEMKRD